MYMYVYDRCCFSAETHLFHADPTRAAAFRDTNMDYDGLLLFFCLRSCRFGRPGLFLVLLCQPLRNLAKPVQGLELSLGMLHYMRVSENEGAI